MPSFLFRQVQVQVQYGVHRSCFHYNYIHHHTLHVDIQGVIHTDPEAALDKIRFMLSAQVDNGGGLPLVKFNHNAGHEGTPDDDF